MPLPNLSGSVKAYMQPLTFDLISKSIVDFEDVETRTTIHTRGVRQSLESQELEVQKTGQRAWKYEDIHVLPTTELKKLKIDDVLIFRNSEYRVVDFWDLSEYGYIEILCAQTFKDE